MNCAASVPWFLKQLPLFFLLYEKIGYIEIRFINKEMAKSWANVLQSRRRALLYWVGSTLEWYSNSELAA